MWDIDPSSCNRHERVWRQCGKHYATCNIDLQEQVGGGSMMV